MKNIWRNNMIYPKEKKIHDISFCHRKFIFFGSTTSLGLVKCVTQHFISWYNAESTSSTMLVTMSFPSFVLFRALVVASAHSYTHTRTHIASVSEVRRSAFEFHIQSECGPFSRNAFLGTWRMNVSLFFVGTTLYLSIFCFIWFCFGGILFCVAFPGNLFMLVSFGKILCWIYSKKAYVFFVLRSRMKRE